MGNPQSWALTGAVLTGVVQSGCAVGLGLRRRRADRLYLTQSRARRQGLPSRGHACRWQEGRGVSDTLREHSPREVQHLCNGASLGVAIGYAQRYFLVPPAGGRSIGVKTDSSASLQAEVGSILNQGSDVDTLALLNRYVRKTGSVPGVRAVGGALSYRRNVGPRPKGSKPVSVSSFRIGGFEPSLKNAAQVGARYTV